MKETGGLISIIIPVFNGEEYLAECIESILRQTYTNLQIVIVNDGSVDGTLSICEHYAEMDRRIKIVSKNNEGLVAARKTGINVAQGRYVGFVDADDWIAPSMYREMYDMMQDSECDLISSGIYRQFGDDIKFVGNTIKTGLYSYNKLETEVFPKMLYAGVYYQMGVRPNVVTKLFRRDLLKGILNRIPNEIANGEDVAISYSYILRSKSIFLTDKVYYHYRQHAQSMSQSFSDKRELKKIKTLYNYLFMEQKESGFNINWVKQVNFYMSHMLVQRYCEIYDNEGTALRIFGGIDIRKNIAIYGAGKFGKHIYQYACKLCLNCIWVDQNDVFYRKQGLPVRSVSETLRCGCNTILIAVLDENMAAQIMRQLHKAGSNAEMKWLDIEYITSGETLNRIGFGQDLNDGDYDGYVVEKI